jgi:hypothetical protein
MPEPGSAPPVLLAGRRTADAAQRAALLTAALSCLQPAIDPVFLTLLSEAGHVPLGVHGVIVGGTQGGAALGALAVWRWRHRMRGRTFLAAAALAGVFSLLTAVSTSFGVLLLLRCGYGAAMGMIFAHTMARSAAHRPNTAYGAMFLLQLLLATLVSLALPALARLAGPHAALAVLALVPALACAALLVAAQGQAAPNEQTLQSSPTPESALVPPAGWALAAAAFCSICATMLVWSFAGALATAAGFDDGVIGEAVALGSLVGAVTALAAMRERVLVPLPVTVLLAGFMVASPMLLTAAGHAQSFILSIVLLNIGSTAMIIRCSGLATATSRDSRFCTFVACTHSLGMIAGPIMGSMLMIGGGNPALLAGVAFILAVGFCATLFAAKQGVGMGAPGFRLIGGVSATNSRQSA